MSKKELEGRTMRSDTSLKLTCYLARSPLPVAALPSMSLIPQLHSRIHTNDQTTWLQNHAVRDNSCRYGSACLASHLVRAGSRADAGRYEHAGTCGVRASRRRTQQDL